MDHILVDIDPDVEDTYFGTTGPSTGWNMAGGSGRPLAVPIEVKMRSLAVKLLYEVSRASKLNKQDLRAFFFVASRVLSLWNVEGLMKVAGDYGGWCRCVHGRLYRSVIRPRGAHEKHAGRDI